MGLFGQVIPQIQAVLTQLFADDVLPEDVIYRSYVGQTFDSGEKRTIDSYNDVPLTAVRLRHNQRSQQVSNTHVEVGDVLFMFDFRGFPENYALKDQIVDAAGTTFDIKGIDNIFELAISVTVKGS